jgi:hypothetical protein
MTLPSSPPLSLTQILAELGRLAAGQSLSGAADERALSDRASGSINFSDYLGKSSTIPFSWTEIGLSGGTYNVGAYSPDRRVVIVETYGSTNGQAVHLTSLRFAGASTSILSQVEGSYSQNQGGDQTVTVYYGAVIGLYSGSAVGGGVDQSSSGGNGVTTATRVFRILGYTRTVDTTGRITTVNGGAGVYVGTRGGTIVPVNPTTGAGIADTGLASASFA